MELKIASGSPTHASYSLIGSILTNRKITQNSSHTKRRAWNTNSSESRGMITPIKSASNYQEMSPLSPSSSGDWWHSPSNKSQRSIDLKVTATSRAGQSTSRQTVESSPRHKKNPVEFGYPKSRSIVNQINSAKRVKHITPL